MERAYLPWRFVRMILLLGVASPLIIYTALYLSWREVKQDSQPSYHRAGGVLVREVVVPSLPHRAHGITDSDAGPATTARSDVKDKHETPGYASRIHAFYYPWYASPAVEGSYLHWNHRILPFWGDKKAIHQPAVYHEPPGDLGAQFYPELGPYSSRSRDVIDTHMRQMNLAGIGVAVVSWYPPKKSDDNGKPSDDILPLLLDAGHRHSVHIAFHLEPYGPRTSSDVKADIKYIIDTYGEHPAFYRTKLSGNAPGRPVVYAYDSYKISVAQWKELLAPGGSQSIRGTKYDCIMVGLVVNKNDLQTLHNAGFDGSYTYFSSRTFTFGSNPDNWKYLSELSAQLNLMFIPSVGPGYDDTAIRPWNENTRQDRAAGKYYRDMIASALELDIEAVSITSFNEWGEGTQIEPAVPFSHSGAPKPRLYLDYSPMKPDGYLQITKEELKHFVPARL